MKKNLTRRKFVGKGLVLSAAIPLATTIIPGCAQKTEDKSAPEQESKKLNILILGGTSFLGPHQIAYAMQRGHTVSTFTRGKTRPTVHQELFDNVNMLIGDRANDLKALETGTWDAVIDNSGHNAEWTRKSAALLKERAGIYLYTSSTGVYYPYLDDNIGENTSLLLQEPENVSDEDMKLEYWYGVMKSNSEIAAREEFGEDRTIVVRPTYMIGPADKSNRFIHWPVRLAKGGEILVPGQPEDPVQYADVRDIGEWMIWLIENKKTGTFNGVGPESPQTMPQFIREAAGAFDVHSEFVQVNDYNFLKSEGVEHIVPWIMPTDNNFGSARINNSKGLEAGLTFRPVQETVRDTYGWWKSSVTEDARKVFEDDAENVLNREQAILAKWKSA